MTLEEANAVAAKLGDINYAIWFADGIDKKKLKQQFKELARTITANGFTLKSKCSTKRPEFCISQMNSCMQIAANRPNDVNANNDCTTRCIAWCTGLDYNLVKKEQYAYAESKSRATGCTYKFNSSSVWMKSLLDRGFEKVILPRHVSRAVFLRKLSSYAFDDIIATVSSGHAAAIDMKSKKVLDMFDSSGGRIKYVLVPAIKAEAYKLAFGREFLPYRHRF